MPFSLLTLGTVVAGAIFCSRLLNTGLLGEKNDTLSSNEFTKEVEEKHHCGPDSVVH